MSNEIEAMFNTIMSVICLVAGVYNMKEDERIKGIIYFVFAFLYLWCVVAFMKG